jgi:hypothetical protein
VNHLILLDLQDGILLLARMRTGSQFRGSFFAFPSRYQRAFVSKSKSLSCVDKVYGSHCFTYLEAKTDTRELWTGDPSYKICRSVLFHIQRILSVANGECTVYLIGQCQQRYTRRKITRCLRYSYHLTLRRVCAPINFPTPTSDCRR